MKITCPMCAQQGSAPDHIIGKKVRCPECKKVFRVDSKCIIEQLPEGITACSKCGFAFSEAFIKQQGDDILCTLCAQLSSAQK